MELARLCACGCGGTVKPNRRFILKHHYQFLKTITPPVQRFVEKINQTSTCWLWTAAATSAGYGSFAATTDDIMQAHRFAYLIFKGPIPEGLFICHRCDVRACVNPDHLFIGTHLDNMRDMDAKGRRRPGHPRGVLAWQAKLNDDAVREIRRLYALGVRNKELCAKFGVASNTMSSLLKGRTWRHVA